MKKVFWGYSTQEVDSALETLSNQNATLIQHNDYMEDEMKSMRTQLDEAKAAIAAGMTQADADGYKELKFAYAALQDKMKNYDADMEKAREEGAGAAKIEAEEARKEAEEAKKAAEEAQNETQVSRTASETAQSEKEQAQKEAEASREELNKIRSEMEVMRSELENARNAAPNADNSSSVSDEDLQKIKAELTNKYEEKLQEFKTEEEKKIQKARDEAYSEGAVSKEHELFRLQAQLEGEVMKRDLMKQQIESLKAELEANIEKLKEESHRSKDSVSFSTVEFDSVLKKMIRDVHETKAESHDKMIKAVDQFSEQWASAHQNLSRELGVLEEEREQSEGELKNAVRSMLDCYQKMEARTQKMQEIIDTLESKRGSLETDLKTTVDKLMDGENTSVPAPKEEAQPSESSTTEKKTAAYGDKSSFAIEKDEENGTLRIVRTFA